MSDAQPIAGSPASTDEHEEGPSRAAYDQAQAGGQPTEEQLRAAYEAELSRISSFELTLQTVVSLLNVGGHRLGLADRAEEQRDLEQVRDAIDGVRALMPVLERRMPAAELRSLRDALAQLQMAYARQAGAQPQAPVQQPSGERAPNRPAASDVSKEGAPDAGPPTTGGEHRPGPAEASGRLWVPGR